MLSSFFVVWRDSFATNITNMYGSFITKQTKINKMSASNPNSGSTSKENFFKLCFYHDALPPCFNVNWNPKNNLFKDVGDIPKHCISHSIEGSGLHQREITVVHPFALWRISSLLYDNWTTIMAHFKTSYPDSTFEALTSPNHYFKPTVPE